MTTYSQLEKLWHSMVNARAFDHAMSTHNPHWHEARGEEGVIVGVFHHAREADITAPHFRGACAVAIMRGEDPAVIAAGVFGKKSGPTAGHWRGDIHPAPSPTSIGMFSGSLGTSVSYATGAGITIKQSGDDRVVLCSFGDGTANAGIVSESMNLAAMLHLPLVFVCQNNQYATSIPSRTAIAGGSLSDRARAYGWNSVNVDGNDVVAVSEATEQAITQVRDGAAPTFIHALTYRMGGHYMNDPEVYRSVAEVEEWGRKDPILKLEQRLAQFPEWDAATAQQYRDATFAAYDTIVADAKAAAEPDPATALFASTTTIPGFAQMGAHP